MKALFAVIGAMVALLLVWLAVDSTKPKLFAQVQQLKAEVVITNRNDIPWRDTTVRLNDTFDLIEHTEPGPWAPGERRSVPLSRFYSRMRKQAFNPEFEHVESVMIDVPGFQLGIYRVRSND